MSAHEILAETGIDVTVDATEDGVELSDESVRGMDDMLNFSNPFSGELQ